MNLSHTKFQNIQFGLAIIAIICFVARWLSFLPEEVREILSKQLFYIFVGLQFILTGYWYRQHKLSIWQYVFGVMCILGGILHPLFSLFVTIGLLGGFITNFGIRR